MTSASGSEAAKALEHSVWELKQRELIMETLSNYCTLVDRNDTAQLAEQVFCEDGRFELGERHAVIGRENLRRMFAKTLAAFSSTSHHVSNVVIRVTGPDSATSTAYVYAWHLQVADGRRVDLWGRYLDQLALTPQGWRIKARRLLAAGSDGWANAPFQRPERLPNPAETPSPEVTRIDRKA